MPIMVTLAAGRAWAEPPTDAPGVASTPAPKRSHSVSGSPLDTLKSTHLWTETAPPQDFVRDSRPEAAALDYAPLTGADPVRPKPRDAANVLALQAELERSRAVNEGKGRPLRALKLRRVTR